MNAIKVQVVKVWLRRAEGPHALCFERTYGNIADADRELRRWALTAPADGGYDKCDFKLTFADGNTYEGRYDLKRADATYGDLIGRHVLEFLRFHAGLRRPSHLTEAQYENFLRLEGSAQKAEIMAFLEKYDLTV